MQSSTQGKYQCYKPDIFFPANENLFFFPFSLFSFEVFQILSWSATGGQQRQDFSEPVLIRGLIDSHLKHKRSLLAKFIAMPNIIW